jgi:hypothetical protein
MVDLIEHAIAEFADVAAPGRYVVDTMPWREYATVLQ